MCIRDSGMMDLDGDGHVSYEEICDYIDERVDGKRRRKKDDASDEETDPRKTFAKALKKHFDDLYYWDRNLRAILWDAVQKASDSQILKCPANDCSWAFKLFSKSAVPPESAFRQHLESKVDDPGHPDWEQLQVILQAPPSVINTSEMVCPRCKSSSSSASSRGQKRPPPTPPPGSSAADKGSTARPAKHGS